MGIRAVELWPKEYHTALSELDTKSLLTSTLTDETRPQQQGNNQNFPVLWLALLLQGRHPLPGTPGAERQCEDGAAVQTISGAHAPCRDSQGAEGEGWIREGILTTLWTWKSLGQKARMSEDGPFKIVKKREQDGPFDIVIKRESHSLHSR